MLNFKCYMESEEDRPTRHRVFTAEKGIFKPKPDHLLGEDPSLAYRITGRPQIDDMLQSGLVRARLGQMRGGRTGETEAGQERGRQDRREGGRTVGIKINHKSKKNKTIFLFIGSYCFLP